MQAGGSGGAEGAGCSEARSGVVKLELAITLRTPHVEAAELWAAGITGQWLRRPMAR